MKGLTVFEFNPESRDVRKAVYRRGSIFMSSNMRESRTTETFILEQKEGCRYFEALNLKNAIRKAKKFLTHESH